MGMFDNIRFPYFNLQQLNLDWLLNEVKRIAGFMPQDGNVGDILTRKSDGAAWEQPAAVQVDIDSLPEDTQIMDNDQLIFYDISAQANRKIKPPNLLDSMCSNGTPYMNGTASPGTSKKPARYDHVHPADTSRAPAEFFQNGYLKVAHGGTAAGDAATARANLNAAEINETGSNYCKMSDGTLIMWGRVVDTAVDVSNALGSIYFGSYSIVFPKAFINTNYAVTGSFRYGTGIGMGCGIQVGSESTTGCTLTLINPISVSGGNGRICWTAVGRWKN